MSELVETLSKELHEVEFEARTDNLHEVENRIRNGFIFIKFINTRGGTELGINVDPAEVNFNELDFKTGVGNLHIEGTCTLDYEKVRCIADIDLSTRTGKGFLKIIN